MDADSELQLYDHVDFLDSRPMSRRSDGSYRSDGSHRKQPYRERTTQRERHTENRIYHDNDTRRSEYYSKKPAIHNEYNRQQLDPFELMFFRSSYDPSPSRSQHLCADDFNRKENYLNKIKKMSNAERRQHRAERDLRYLHKNAEQPSHDQKVAECNDESNLFCVHHLIGKCNKESCERAHQMREPRMFGVCRFFLSKSCVKGDSCDFMHSEFPCRYYYLDLDHPKSSNEEECQFNHGGPLNIEMNRYFKRHIEFWVKDITAAKPEDFEIKLEDFIERFDLKQVQLEEKQKHEKKKAIIIPGKSNKFTWESCLDGNQLELLEKHGIDSIEKINNTSVNLLLECGLTMDQIYEITVKTCDGTRSPVRETIESDDEIIDFGHSSEVDSDTYLGTDTNETQQRTIEKDSYENRRGHDEQSESEIQSECDSFSDIITDFEMSDDSDTDNLVINENENDNEDM